MLPAEVVHTVNVSVTDATSDRRVELSLTCATS